MRYHSCCPLDEEGSGLEMLLRDNGLLSLCTFRGHDLVVFVVLCDFGMALGDFWILLAGLVREWVGECWIGMEMVYMFVLSCT